MHAPEGEVLMVARTHRPRQHEEALLLAVIKTLIKRAGGVGELLERGAACRHIGRCTLHSLDRVDVLCWLRGGRLIASRLTLIFRARVVASLEPLAHPLGAEFRHIAVSLLERRPVLLLISRQLQPGLERGHARIGKGADVFGARPPMTQAICSGATLLRIQY